jgi:hypothetical protein
VLYGWLTRKAPAFIFQVGIRCQPAPPSRTDYLKTSRRPSRCNYYRKDCLILIVVRRGFTSQSSYAVLTSATGELSSANSCSCQAGGVCQCCTPRKSAPRRRKTGDRKSDEEYDSQKGHIESKRSHQPPTPSSPLSSQVLARIAELRPVLPRPSNRSIHLSRPSHDPSSGVAHNHAPRHYTRDNMMFSPYGRAYDMTHGFDPAYGRHDAPETSVQQTPQGTQNLHRPAVLTGPQSLDIPSSVESWLSTGESFPSACNCGDGCTCPGCLEHNGGRAAVPGVSAFSSCANPGTCSHCLDCTILSLPASIPPDTALSIFDSPQSQSIDEWIRQISAQSNLISDNVPTSLSTDLAIPPGYAPSSWENVQMPRISEPTRNSSSECCNARCKCPSGSCTCPADCCGCCQGCECAEHEHRGDLEARTGGVTFATSGERGSCCSGARRRVNRSLESFERGGRLDLSRGASSPRHLINGNRGLLDIPDLSRSRSSSTSSQSVPESGYSTDLSTMFTTPRPVVSNKLPSSRSSSSASSGAQLHILGSSKVSPQSRSPDCSRIDLNTGVAYAISNPDSEVSSDDQGYSPYTPSLDGIRLY